MVSEWTIAPVEEVAEKAAMGPFGSSIRVETFVPGSVPLINGQHLAKDVRVRTDSVYRLAQEGKLPASKVGAQWRFKREKVDRWMEGQGVAERRQQAGDPHA